MRHSPSAAGWLSASPSSQRSYLHQAFKTWEIPSVFPSFLIIHQATVSETKKGKLGEREEDKQLSPSLQVTAPPQHRRGRFAQCGTDPDHTTLVLLIPDMGSSDSLWPFSWPGNTPPRKYFAVWSWRCRNLSKHELAQMKILALQLLLISLSRAISHPRSGKVHNWPTCLSRSTYQVGHGANPAHSSVNLTQAPRGRCLWCSWAHPGDRDGGMSRMSVKPWTKHTKHTHLHACKYTYTTTSALPSPHTIGVWDLCMRHLQVFQTRGQFSLSLCQHHRLKWLLYTVYPCVCCANATECRWLDRELTAMQKPCLPLPTALEAG